MSTALSAIADTFGQEQSRAKKVLLLTDGKNEGEQRAALDREVARCAAANISVSAWGVGADWDEKELRYIADQTCGDADIIPTPQQIGAAFAAAFSEMRKTALTDVQMYLWSPVGVTINKIEQVYPQIVPLATYPDSANPRHRIVSLGSFAAGDQRDYLIDLEVPAYAPGQQFLIVRPLMKYYAAGSGEEERSERKGWVFAQWQANTAEVQTYIDRAIGNETYPEERESFSVIQRDWGVCYALDAQIRQTAAASGSAAAERISTGRSNGAFGVFTATVDRLSAANRSYFDRTFQDT